jgi:hypothetical protein
MSIHRKPERGARQSRNRSAPISDHVIAGVRSQTGSSHWALRGPSETVIQPDLRGDGGELPSKVEAAPPRPAVPMTGVRRQRPSARPRLNGSSRPQSRHLPR